MGKGGSKQCFITLPSLAASTNGLPPSMRAREMVFCKEGVSQRLWRSWPLHFPSFNSTCCRDAQPNAWAHCSANAEHDAGEGWGFAGVPPPRCCHRLPCFNSARWFNNWGWMCRGTGSSMPPGDWGDGERASRHHPGHRAGTAVGEPCWCGGCSSSSRGACSLACPAAPRHVPPWQQFSATAGILMRAGQSPASLSPFGHQEL